jgi:biopolymer transport protein ExbD
MAGISNQSGETRGAMFGARRSFLDPDESETEVVDLNLAPLMDVLSNVLFFLLAGFGAAIVSVLNASIPTVGDVSAEALEKARHTVTVILRVQDDGYSIQGQSTGLKPKDQESMRVHLPKIGDDYDTRSLSSFLYTIKTKYPASDTVIIVPDPTIKYEKIIETMDASRDYQRDTNAKPVEMFPSVVVSGIVQ